MALSKIDRVLALLDGEGKQVETPAAFFLHFGGEYRSGQAAIRRHREFFEFTGMDIVKIQLEVPWPKFEVKEVSDWARFPKIGSETWGSQVEVVHGLVDALGKEAIVIVTLYSPLMVANDIGGRERLRNDLSTHGSEAEHALESTAEALREFVRACLTAGVDGFYASTQGAEVSRFESAEVFERHVKPFDLALMSEFAAKSRFSILHICDYHRDEYGEYRDLALFADYPCQVVSASPRMGGRTWTAQEVSDAMGGRPFFGGIDRLGPLATGSVEDARRAAQDALNGASTRFMLGAECTVPGNTPWENLRAAIEVAHSR